MRPNPRRPSPEDDPDRIIYLGDVRRRRSSRGRVPDRQYLAVIGLTGIACWGLWIAVVSSVQPVKLLTYLAFFVPLALALAATFTLALYAIDWRRGLLPRLGRCIQRGCLGSGIAVVNLAFQAAHFWSIIILGGSIAVAVMADIASQPREA